MVSHRFPPDAVAGVERYTESLAAELRAGGDEVTVVTRRPGPGPVRTVSELHDDGTPLFRLTGGGVDRSRVLHLTTALERSFEEILEEVRPEVVHFNHLIDLSPRFLAMARDAGAAVVVTLHDFWFACPRITLRRPDGSQCDGPDAGRACATSCYGGADDMARLTLRALYFRRLLELPDRVLCPSPYVAGWFRAWGADPARIRSVANGITLPREAPPERPTPESRGRLVLVALGAVVPHKGYHVAIEALEAAGLPAVELLVHGPIGDDEYARQLREEAAGVRGLTLRLCGPYEPDELDLLLEDADCLLAPSVWPETFCLVIREALTRGVPAVTTELGALVEAVDDGVNGFHYRHDRPGELARILERLAREPGLVGRLRSGALATSVTSVAEHAREVRNEYVEAIERRDCDEPGRGPADAELEVLEELMAVSRVEGRGAEAVA